MGRSLALALTFLAAIGSRAASAQTASPVVELGVDVGASFLPDSNGIQRGPRLVVDFDGRNALQLTASFQELSRLDASADSETDIYLAVYRRLVHAAGPVRVFATIGGGLERTLIVTQPVTFGNPPITFPSTRGTEVWPAFTTGAAVEFRVASRAAIVLESSFVLTETLGGRVAGGLVVPLRSYPSRDRLAASVPWAELDAGERAWITTADGREVEGVVAQRSSSALTLRTESGVMSFTAEELRAIDTTDPIRNGAVLGAKIGGFGAIVPSVLISLLVCAFEEEECDVNDVLTVNGVLIGMGTGIGAVTGAMVDSLRERRAPLYRRADGRGVRVAPIVDRHRVGGRAVIRW
jgi:hypothetical protein